MPPYSDALPQSDVPAAKQRLARWLGAGLLAGLIAVLALLSPTPALAAHAAQSTPVLVAPSL